MTPAQANSDTRAATYRATASGERQSRHHPRASSARRASAARSANSPSSTAGSVRQSLTVTTGARALYHRGGSGSETTTHPARAASTNRNVSSKFPRGQSTTFEFISNRE